MVRGPGCLHETEGYEKIFGPRIAMGSQEGRGPRLVAQPCKGALQFQRCDADFIAQLVRVSGHQRKRGIILGRAPRMHPHLPAIERSGFKRIGVRSLDLRKLERRKVRDRIPLALSGVEQGDQNQKREVEKRKQPRGRISSIHRHVQYERSEDLHS